MYLLFQTGTLCLFKKSLNHTVRKLKLIRNNSDVPRKFITFDEVNAQRRAEASRSLVVQVNSESSFSELYNYCTKYATINNIQHYKNSTEEHFMLIEFSDENNLKDVLKTCSSYQKEVDVMAIQSPFLWFRAIPGLKEKQCGQKRTLCNQDGNHIVDDDTLFAELLSCQTVSDQIQHLHDRTMLNDIGVRLRYIVARQLEVMFSSLYSNIVVHPFGSSVNGFGKMGCDLDLVLTNNVSPELVSIQRRLVFQEKGEGGRQLARQLELVAALLELRAPAASRVTRILNARVPIVKYSHTFTDLDCDLCYNNMSGVYMSELMRALGGLDGRVRPLTFAVRRWARAAALTQPHPGRWLTNFPLTLLVLFFLQQRPAVLPPVDELVQAAGKEDIRIAEENLNCTFLRDLNRLPNDTYSQSTDNLETLLLKFFEFYSQFDFQEKAISINKGVPIRKPNSLPLYIMNPLETNLNVSRNVSYEECERFKLEVRNAAWQLETFDEKKGDDWGILSLIEKKAARGLKKLLRVGNSHRLVSVKDLFKDDDPTEPIRPKLHEVKKTDNEIEANVREIKTHLAGKEAKEQKMKYKNGQVANEVYRIRRNKLV